MPIVSGFGLTEEEYDALGELAGNAKRNDYVKQLVLKHLSDARAATPFPVEVLK